METYDVRSIPTLVLIDEDEKVLGVSVGQQSKAKLTEWIHASIVS